MSVVYFAHGKESGPWGSKIMALAAVAQNKGYKVISPDYSDLADPDLRVNRLLDLCKPGAADVLVGSSMGGYVSAVVSSVIYPKAMFLMAPALSIPGYASQNPAPGSVNTVIVHGWNDDIVPVDSSIQYARLHMAQLHLVDSDHRLNDKIGILCLLFGDMLERLTS